LATRIDKGLRAVEAVQKAIRHDVEEIKEVAATLDPGTGPCGRREAVYQTILARIEGDGDAVHEHMAKLMAGFRVGLFAGGDAMDQVQEDLDLGTASALRHQLVAQAEAGVHRITLDLSDEELEALDEATRTGRFASVEDALKAGIRCVARSEAQRRDIATAYRLGYERFPQDPKLGEVGADLLADIVEAEPPKS